MDNIFELIPFRFLTHAQQERLKASTELIEVPQGTRIIRHEEADDRSVYILLEGAVNVVDPHSREVVNQVEAGQYFGDRAALFDTPRTHDVVARDHVRCVGIEHEAFLAAVSESPAFAMGLGQILRVKQGLLREFDAFRAALLHGVETNTIQLSTLMQLYQRLDPALHRGANMPDTIDFNGLSYALGRLPQNITRTFALFLTDNLPDMYHVIREHFTPVPIAARRRTVYEMMPGKSMILLRDGVSDIIDLLTCLCLLRVEAQKIRRRFTDPVVYKRLIEAGLGPDGGQLDALPFSPGERRKLRQLWGDDAVMRIYEMTLHHEDLGVEITKQIDSFNVRHSERWTLQIARATRELMGCDPSALPDDIDVHIISSNTHSVTNCLSPWLADKADDIMAWGREHHPEICALPWTTSTDCVYAIARHYLRHHPEARHQKRAAERAAGMLQLVETAFTGIEVELVDTAALRGNRIDPGICAIPDGSRALIVNIDYAFGQQAEEILFNLILLFGEHIASVSVLGKAGALEGGRGDLLVADTFLEQDEDTLHPLPQEPAINLERLHARVPGREMHKGPMLTVAGTLMQNALMLNFYRRIWRCVGLEMEGSYYLRQLLKARALGLVRSDVALSFLYYVSDVPLDHGATLAGALGPHEGIPPLYAITREVLTSIFESEAPTPKP